MNGRENPRPVVISLRPVTEPCKLTHEAPVLESKALLQRVKGQVATRTLGVVVWAGELSAGGLEAATGDERRGRGGAEGSTSEHLQTSVTVAIGVILGRTLAVW
jgi:hypothetical protein